MTELQRADIQGLVLSAYGHLPCAAYLLLGIAEPIGARRWLAQLTDDVTDAVAKDQERSLNVALTYDGLAKLELPQSALDSFPIAFREGMASAQRAQILGDTGENHFSAWDWGSGDRQVHILLMLYGKNEATLEAHLRVRKEAARAGGLSILQTLSAGRQPDSREHFGFADGIGQPVLEGNDQHARKQLTRTGHATVVKAGEFILGYVNEYGVPAVSPTVDAKSDPQGLLPEYNVPADLRFAGADARSLRNLGYNGSYLVFRQLAQDVAKFWQFLDEATRVNGRSDPAARERLSAKFVGRWRSGAALVKSPHADDVSLKDDNNFGFAQEDPQGHACPIGAHIRRSNPRDSLGDDPQASLAAVRRHRLLRRGRSYGHRIADPLVDDEQERGLFFICLNADLERQFEFVQQTWLNNTVFGGLYEETDPLVGNQDPDYCSRIMTVPDEPLRRRVHNLCRFVTTKGGGYFFLPGLKALRYLSSIDGGLKAKDQV